MLLFHVNILSVLILTVDRYVSIVHCLRYPSIMTVPRARTLVCVLWALSIVYSLTYIIFSPPEYSDEAHICYQLKDSLNFSITIIIILTSVMVILALYTRLVMIAHRHKKRIAQQEFPSANPALRMRFKAKSLLTFCIIVLSLAVCWLPEVIALMVAKTTRRKNDILRWTFVLQNASCWLNMVIYYLRNKDFRQTAHGIFTTWLGSCKYCKSTDVRFEHWGLGTILHADMLDTQKFPVDNTFSNVKALWKIKWHFHLKDEVRGPNCTSHKLAPTIPEIPLGNALSLYFLCKKTFLGLPFKQYGLRKNTSPVKIVSFCHEQCFGMIARVNVDKLTLECLLPLKLEAVKTLCAQVIFMRMTWWIINRVVNL